VFPLLLILLFAPSPLILSSFPHSISSTSSCSTTSLPASDSHIGMVCLTMLVTGSDYKRGVV
jgi:hypothetical protein